MTVDGQVALVTGGGRGIGKSIVESLAKAGAKVAIVSRTLREIQSLSEELNLQGYTTIAIQADVSRSDQVQRAVEATKSHWGTIDILVNNAGWDQMEKFIDSTEEDWIKVIDINLLGQMRFCKEVLPWMIEKGYGRIINISSDAGRVGTSGQVPYSAAKGGVIAFTKGLAREVVRHGITVNCVAPGPIDTPLYREIVESNEKLTAAVVKAIPMKRVGEPEEVAHIVLMTAAKEASYLTGQTISVSGGLTMI
jgi:2-hydroxycyclohexanecarboxyl-CoA dehydrogenase